MVRIFRIYVWFRLACVLSVWREVSDTETLGTILLLDEEWYCDLICICFHLDIIILLIRRQWKSTEVWYILPTDAPTYKLLLLFACASCISTTTGTQPDRESLQLPQLDKGGAA